MRTAKTDQTGRMPRLILVVAGRTLTLLVLSCRSSNKDSNCIHSTVNKITSIQAKRQFPLERYRRVPRINKRGRCKNNGSNPPPIFLFLVSVPAPF